MLLAALKRAEAALEAAQVSGDLLEVQALRRELGEVVARQAQAVERAGADWDREQQSLERRLRPESGIDGKLLEQLQERMYEMPSRQTVTDRAAAAFAEGIVGLEGRLAAAIGTPDPQVLVRIESAARLVDATRAELTAFEDEAADHERDRAERERALSEAAVSRSERIEALETQAAAAKQAVAEAAAASQMHRWAAFVFVKNPAEITEERRRWFPGLRSVRCSADRPPGSAGRGHPNAPHRVSGKRCRAGESKWPAARCNGPVQQRGADARRRLRPPR